MLLVEDIVDTGFTLRYLLQHAGRTGARIRSPSARSSTATRAASSQVPVDFRCFEIPDRFVVGFGLDYNQLYRNLDYVAVLKPEKNP